MVLLWQVLRLKKFGTERLIGLSQADVEERVQEFVDLVQFDIELV